MVRDFCTLQLTLFFGQLWKFLRRLEAKCQETKGNWKFTRMGGAHKYLDLTLVVSSLPPQISVLLGEGGTLALGFDQEISGRAARFWSITDICSTMLHDQVVTTWR